MTRAQNTIAATRTIRLVVGAGRVPGHPHCYGARICLNRTKNTMLDMPRSRSRLGIVLGRVYVNGSLLLLKISKICATLSRWPTPAVELTIIFSHFVV